MALPVSMVISRGMPVLGLPEVAHRTVGRVAVNIFPRGHVSGGDVDVDIDRDGFW